VACTGVHIDTIDVKEVIHLLNGKKKVNNKKAASHHHA
jgi:hypothetical protein